MKAFKTAILISIFALFGAGSSAAQEEPKIEYTKELKAKLADEKSEAKQVKIATKELDRCESDFQKFAKKANKEAEKQAKELQKKDEQIAKKDSEIAKRDSANGCASNAKTGMAAGVAGAIAGASVAMAVADNRYEIEEEFALLWECINGGNASSLSNAQYQKLAKCCANSLREIQKEYSSLKAYQKSGTSIGASCR